MMILTNQELIKEYYNQVKDKYPDLTEEQIKEICFGPWRYLKSEMENGQLDTVRFKYFGTFQVYKGRAKFMLINLKKRFKLNKIDPSQYYELKKMIETFLKKE